jgi:hypothetical protein
MTLARQPRRMKPFSVERPAFSVKSSFGVKRNAATGLALNA